MTLRASIPMLASSRDRAQQILTGVDTDLAGYEFRLDGELLIEATASFADEVVLEVLVRRDADALQLSRCPDEFIDLILERAAAHGVDDRVKRV